jgi:hypothetical protein
MSSFENAMKAFSFCPISQRDSRFELLSVYVLYETWFALEIMNA